MDSVTSNASNTNIHKAMTINKVRFGELAAGDVFHAFGHEMRKKDDYNAETTAKRGKQQFLFFKQNLVEVDVSPFRPNIISWPKTINWCLSTSMSIEHN